MATHSSILACKIPWTEEPDQLKVELLSGLWGGLWSPALLASLLPPGFPILSLPRGFC